MLILFSFYAFFVFLFGITIGSFLNVCIYRIPLEISVAEGRSFCPCCGKQLKAVDLIPILSFVFLRGKCRFCSAPISIQYPLVELSTGLLFLLAFLRLGFHWKMPVMALFFAVLLVIAVIDQQTGYIYDRLNAAILLLALVYMLIPPQEPFLPHILGAVAVSLPLLLLAVLFHGFGGGDVKLAFCAGLFLGLRLMLIAAFLSVVTCGIYSIYLLLKKRAALKTELPFGPFLAFGMVAAVILGDPLWSWYASLLF